jgi:hypothetical protein
MKTSLQQKLKNYTALAGAMTAAGAAADAQIIYTDITPDAVINPSQVVNIDLNGDNVNDFQLGVEQYLDSLGNPLVTLAVCQVQNPANGVLGTLYYGQYPLPFNLNNGDSIAASNPNWNAGSINSGLQYLSIVYGPGIYGYWNGATDKYLGVRFVAGNNTHYGWIRLSVNTGSTQITVKDMAYQALPNVGLTAGQLVGVAELMDNGVNVIQQNNQIIVNVTEGDVKGVVRVYSATGALISEEQLTSAQHVVNTGAAATGVYIVRVDRGDKSYVKRVYVAK